MTFSKISVIRTMYEGELASLTKLQQTNIIKVPKPIKIINRGEMSFFVLEYLLINPLRKQAASNYKHSVHLLTLIDVLKLGIPFYCKIFHKFCVFVVI